MAFFSSGGWARADIPLKDEVRSERVISPGAGAEPFQFAPDCDIHRREIDACIQR